MLPVWPTHNKLHWIHNKDIITHATRTASAARHLPTLYNKNNATQAQVSQSALDGSSRNCDAYPPVRAVNTRLKRCSPSCYGPHTHPQEEERLRRACMDLTLFAIRARTWRSWFAAAPPPRYLCLLFRGFFLHAVNGDTHPHSTQSP